MRQVPRPRRARASRPRERPGRGAASGLSVADVRLSRVTQLPHPTRPEPQFRPPARQSTLQRRLEVLRGPARDPRPLDSRGLAALAANPGCARRALLDSAGVNKAAVADALGAPSGFGQSQFAFARGHAFESRVTADGGLELVQLLCEATGQQPPDSVFSPDSDAEGAQARCGRTKQALAEATSYTERGGWAVLLHPMVQLEVAGAPVYLEPDALVVAPGGTRTVVEIKSFPILDGSADPAKVGAAARQAAVYVLALTETTEAHHGEATAEPQVAETALLVCPKDFSNLPTAATVDLRKQVATVRRQLRRLTRVEEIAAALPEGLSFDPDQPAGQLREAVAAVPAAYAPDCLAGCDLAFHCRSQARAAGEPALLGRGVRAELGGLDSIEAALAAAHGPRRPSAVPSDLADSSTDDPDTPRPASLTDPAVAALRRAARLRAEALASADGRGTVGGEPCR